MKNTFSGNFLFTLIIILIPFYSFSNGECKDDNSKYFTLTNRLANLKDYIDIGSLSSPHMSESINRTSVAKEMDSKAISTNHKPDSTSSKPPIKDDETKINDSKTNYSSYFFSHSLLLSGSVGYMFGLNKLEMPDLSSTWYNNKPLDKELSQIGNIANPSYEDGINFSANLFYRLGKKSDDKCTGISVGFSMTNFTAAYSIDNARYCFKDFDGTDYYRRIITLKESKEDISYTAMNIPIIFSYKKMLNQKWGFDISGGPSYTIMKAKSSYNAVFDFEGIYQYDNLNTQGSYKSVYYDVYTPNSNDILFTRAGVENNANYTDANAYFDQLRSVSNNSYDFALDKTKTNDGATLENRTGIGMNANIEFLYLLSTKLAWKFGFNFSYAKLSNSSDDGDYKMIDKTTDDYVSFYNANGSSTYMSYGISSGIIIGLSK